MSETHFTAWLTTDPGALQGDLIDVAVIEDEPISERADGTTVWSSHGGTADFYAETTITTTYSHADMAAMAEAEALVEGAGWTFVSSWEGCDSGYTATVEKA